MGKGLSGSTRSTHQAQAHMRILLITRCKTEEKAKEMLIIRGEEMLVQTRGKNLYYETQMFEIIL